MTEGTDHPRSVTLRGAMPVAGLTSCFVLADAFYQGSSFSQRQPEQEDGK